MGNDMIYHLFSKYTPKDPESVRRHQVAQMTWKKQPWTERGIGDDSFKRMWVEEGKVLPFIRDLFDKGCEGLKDEEIVVYTNSDIMVRSDACAVLASHLQETDACYSYRRDFHHRITYPIADKEYLLGCPYPGSDLVGFRVGWWRENWQRMPDMIIGMEAYDPVIRTLIDKTNPGPHNSVPDIICHERHYSWWEDPSNRYRLRGQLMNLALAKSFLTANGVDPRTHGIPL